MQIFALLGAHPDLSIAEIGVVTNSAPSWQAGQIAIFDDIEGDLSALQNRLGGTQKLGVVIGSYELPPPGREGSGEAVIELSNFLAQDLISEHPDGKVNFGISMYGADLTRLSEIRTATRNLGLETKSRLKEAGRSARYVISKEATLSAVVVTSNHLLTKGAEYVFIVRDNDIVIGRTVAVQNVDDWAHRDFDRPRRNAKQGMLPPKLARIMVNLTGLDPNSKTLLDPFCGSGTVLMEAGLVGYANVIGGDVNGTAVSDTQANHDWLIAENLKTAALRTYVAPAKEVINYVGARSVDAVVTETYLGRPRKGIETDKEIRDAVDYLGRLFEESFASIKEVMRPGAVLIVAAPVHYLNDEPHFVPVTDILQKLGYTPSPFSCGPLIYRHKDQYVGRQILRFKLPQ